MIKHDGAWQEVDWQVALEFVAAGLKKVRQQHGAAQIGALATPHQTLEELYLLQKLARGLGNANVDFRLRQADFHADAKVVRRGSACPSPPSATRSRAGRRQHAAQRSSAAGEPLAPGCEERVADQPDQPGRRRSPDARRQQGDRCAVAARRMRSRRWSRPLRWRRSVAFPPTSRQSKRGRSGTSASPTASCPARSRPFSLGNFAQHHPAAAQLHALAQALADVTGAKFGFLGEAANSVGGYLASAVPGLNAGEMFAQPRKAYVLLGVEPEVDCDDPRGASRQ